MGLEARRVARCECGWCRGGSPVLSAVDTIVQLNADQVTAGEGRRCRGVRPDQGWPSSYPARTGTFDGIGGGANVRRRAQGRRRVPGSGPRGLAFAFPRQLLKINDAHHFVRRCRAVSLPQTVMQGSTPRGSVPRCERRHHFQLNNLHVAPLLDGEVAKTRPLAQGGNAQVGEFCGGFDRHRGMALEGIVSVVSHGPYRR